MITLAARVTGNGEQHESTCQGMDETLSSFHVAAFNEDVVCDLVDVRLGLCADAVLHQRDEEGATAIRRRRRCFASSASSFMDSSLIGRPPSGQRRLRLIERREDFQTAAFALFQSASALGPPPPRG